MIEKEGVANGSRFCIISGDKIRIEEIGEWVMGLYPEYDAATTISTGRDHQGKKVDGMMDPIWLRVQGRNDLIRETVGIDFMSYEETLRDTIESCVALNGVQPKLRAA